MNETKTLLTQARENVYDHSLSLLSNAVYRGQGDAKKLERQTAKIGRALDKAIHELNVLEKMVSDSED